MKVKEAVIKLLESFGYQYTGADEWFLKFAVSKAENHIKNNCNISRVPSGLYQVWAQIATGEFLFAKKSTGDLNIEGLDLDAAVKKIHEGDTIVEFAYGSGSYTPEQRLDVFIGSLLNSGAEDFAAYRKVCW